MMSSSWESVRSGAIFRKTGTRRGSSPRASITPVSSAQSAARLLARPYTISGHVIHGRKLGRSLGFPTLNLRVPFDRPALSGVFAVRVHGIDTQPLPGVASLGTRPVVEFDGRFLLEVHLFDFGADLYGRLVRVEFIRKLRDERNFDSLDALTVQIDADARQARRVLARFDEGLPR